MLIPLLTAFCLLLLAFGFGTSRYTGLHLELLLIDVGSVTFQSLLVASLLDSNILSQLYVKGISLYKPFHQAALLLRAVPFSILICFKEGNSKELAEVPSSIPYIPDIFSRLLDACISAPGKDEQLTRGLIWIEGG